jgi:predicted nucleic acid-binding protein
VIVVDASVVSSLLLDDGDWGDQLRARIRGEELHAPHLIDLEVLSVFRGALRSRMADLRRVEEALDDLVVLPIRRSAHTLLLGRIHELRNSVTPYDAAYVALAEFLGVSLLTADARLSRAQGPTCPVELLTES